MLFYLVCYMSVGIVANTAYHMHLQTGGPLALPAWALTNQVLAQRLILVCAIAPVLAVLTSLINSGFWVVATIVEIFIGYVLGNILSIDIRAIIFSLSPVVLTVIFGALWGFWYIF